jgi:hypothetical protein
MFVKPEPENFELRTWNFEFECNAKGTQYSALTWRSQFVTKLQVEHKHRRTVALLRARSDFVVFLAPRASLKRTASF